MLDRRFLAALEVVFISPLCALGRKLSANLANVFLRGMMQGGSRGRGFSRVGGKEVFRGPERFSGG
jgi:hypothetical protein